MKARGSFGWPKGVLAALLGGTGVSTAAANTVLAGPTSGPAAPMAPRALVATDVSAFIPGTFKNLAGRNGGLEIWQRGAGGSASIAVAASTTAYTADGWCLVTGANQASTVAQVAGIAAGSRFAARVRRNAGQTGTGTMTWEFPLDTDEIVPMQGQIVVMSMTLLAGANWSPTSGNLLIELRTGTGSAAKRSAGAYTGDAAPISVTQPLVAGGAAARVQFVSTAIGATVTQASIFITWSPTGTAGAADDFTIDDVQLELGLNAASSAATTFERRPFNQEMAACQRHFWKSFTYATAPAQNVGAHTGCLETTMQAAGVVQQAFHARYPVPMRVNPTLVTYNPAAANANVRDVSIPVDGTTVATTNASAEAITIVINANAASVVGSIMQIHATADAGI